MALLDHCDHLRPGGGVEAFVFVDGFARLEDAGTLVPVEVITCGVYESTDDAGRFCLYLTR